ncbi:MAG: LysE family transporter [bacterium]|nr:LysE family transporter [bacterium]
MFAFYFLFATSVSFFGSMQPGPVNLTVLSACVQSNFKKAFYIAIGGSIPEVFYSFCAILFAYKIETYTAPLQKLSSYVALVFMLIGVILFFIQSSANTSPKKESKYGLVTGFLVSIINPQLILFWIAIIAALQVKQFSLVKAGFISQMSFALGTGVGAFLLHYALIYFVRTYSTSNAIQMLRQYGNKMMGAMLFVLGLVQYFLS